MTNSVQNILIGVSGGIAAYKVPFLVRLLRKEGYNVKCVLTKSAEGLVGIDALRTLTGNPVYTERVGEHDMNHVRLEEWADLYLIAPATANSIAKFCHGIADNLLSTLFLSIKAPKVIVPAMNVNMWENIATKTNMETLKSRGITILPVGIGELACGVTGAGRMIEPEDIVRYIDLAQFNTNLSGKKILVVSGPTEEPIDAVRVITNRSSGQMGNGMVRAAIAQSAEVTMISGPALTAVPAGCTVISVQTAQEMYNSVTEIASEFDAIIMVAAVSDYRSKQIITEKLAREKTEEFTLELISNPDIAATIGSSKRDDQRLVTFALESGGVDRAIEKMNRKVSDISIYNKIDQSLEKPTATITILNKDGSQSKEFHSISKEICGQLVMDELAKSWEC